MGLGPKHKKRIWYTAAIGGVAGITGLTALGVMTGMTPASSPSQSKDRQATAAKTLTRPAMDGGGAENDAVEIGCDEDELIQAIIDANDGGGKIKLAADCTYNLTRFRLDDENDEPVGLPEIEDSVTIEGLNSTIQRDASADPFRIFDVDAGGHLTLKNVAVKYGDAQNVGQNLSEGGGGLLVEEGGEVTLEHAKFAFNRTDTDGGAIANNGLVKFVGSNEHGKDAVSSSGTSSDWGGKDGTQGVSADVHDNHADEDGGGIWNSGIGLVRVENARIAYNTADDGGGLFNFDVMELKNVEVDHNFAHDDGGGIFNDWLLKAKDIYVHDNTAGNGVGGGIYNDFELYLHDSKVRRNTAYGDGGGIFTDEGTELSVSNSKINQNTTFGNGGGIFNAGKSGSFGGVTSLRDSEVNQNEAVGANSQAGGIFNDDEGFLRLSNTKVNENVSTNAPGGVFNSDNGEVEIVDDSEITKNRPTNCEESPGEVEGCFG
jgi:hypothetical protein